MYNYYISLPLGLWFIDLSPTLFFCFSHGIRAHLGPDGFSTTKPQHDDPIVALHWCEIERIFLLRRSGTIESKASAYVKSICRGFRAVMGIEGPCSLFEEGKKSGMMSLSSLNSIVRAIRLLFLSVLLLFIKAKTTKSCSGSKLGSSQISRNLIPGRRSINNNILIPCANQWKSFLKASKKFFILK